MERMPSMHVDIVEFFSTNAVPLFPVLLSPLPVKCDPVLSSNGFCHA
jgi:hypothetical protein